MSKLKLLSSALVATGFSAIIGGSFAADTELVDSSFKSLTGSIVNGRVQFASPTEDTTSLNAAQMNGNRSLHAMLKLTELNDTLDAKINQLRTDTNSQIATTNSNLATTNSRLNTARSQISSLSGTVSEHSSAISYLQGASSSASSSLSSLQADLNATKAKLVNNLVYTAGQSCNTTLTARQSDGTPLVCKSGRWKAVSVGVTASGGGSYKKIEFSCENPNSKTGACSCPAGYSGVKVDSYVDWGDDRVDLFACL
ncbi:MAG: hypothetical protein U9N57_01285 [Pseudomonadota bacterium]|nr:hypothetical protein [Pseudomonadota bacterium]